MCVCVGMCVSRRTLVRVLRLEDRSNGMYRIKIIQPNEDELDEQINILDSSSSQNLFHVVHSDCLFRFGEDNITVPSLIQWLSRWTVMSPTTTATTTTNQQTKNNNISNSNSNGSYRKLELRPELVEYYLLNDFSDGAYNLNQIRSDVAALPEGYRSSLAASAVVASSSSSSVASSTMTNHHHHHHHLNNNNNGDVIAVSGRGGHPQMIMTNGGGGAHSSSSSSSSLSSLASPTSPASSSSSSRSSKSGKGGGGRPRQHADRKYPVQIPFNSSNMKKERISNQTNLFIVLPQELVAGALEVWNFFFSFRYVCCLEPNGF